MDVQKFTRGWVTLVVIITASSFEQTLAQKTVTTTTKAPATTAGPNTVYKVPSHGITHCEVKPVVCTAVCGTGNPSCELAGNCICRTSYNEDMAKGVPCVEPKGLEAKRCHPRICKSTFVSKPLVCQVTKKLKICACFPKSTVPDFDYPEVAIAHCSFSPYACARLCGSTNPGCYITGQCHCNHHPSPDAQCAVPSMFELAKCNNSFCQRRGYKAYVCLLDDENFCVCSPPAPASNEDTSSRLRGYTEF